MTLRGAMTAHPASRPARERFRNAQVSTDQTSAYNITSCLHTIHPMLTRDRLSKMYKSEAKPRSYNHFFRRAFPSVTRALVSSALSDGVPSHAASNDQCKSVRRSEKVQSPYVNASSIIRFCTCSPLLLFLSLRYWSTASAKAEAASGECCAVRINLEGLTRAEIVIRQYLTCHKALSR